jgi:hypothetical protein
MGCSPANEPALDKHMFDTKPGRVVGVWSGAGVDVV